MKSKKHGYRVKTLISKSILAVLFIISLLFQLGCQGRGVPAELYKIVPESADTVIIFNNLKEDLKPFVRSDFYKQARKLSIFDAEISSDISAPLLSALGDAEEALGFNITLKRLLFVMGNSAVLYTTDIDGEKATVLTIKTEWFKRFILGIVSRIKGGITREEVAGISMWTADAGDEKLYFENMSGYTVFSDSPHAIKAQLNILDEGASKTISENDDFTALLSNIDKDYHLLIYQKEISKDPSLTHRALRLINGGNSLIASVTFRDGGADVSLYAPYLPDGGERAYFNGFAELGKLEDKTPPDVYLVPAETALLVTFNALDPIIFYDHFYQNWFYDVNERANYLSVLNKWKVEKGFDIEGGIIANLGGGALLTVTGPGYDGRRPYLKTMVAFGVNGGGEESLASNVSALMKYAMKYSGPETIAYSDAEIYYMGGFREKNIEWTGNTYLNTRLVNPGFALKDERLYLARDITTIMRIIDLETLRAMDGAKDLVSRDFLVNSRAFIDSQKDLPIEDYDLYLFIDGEKMVSVVETYLVNLKAHYRYFLYEDSEKMIIPLLELSRESFVSLYGGLDFGVEAEGGVKGTFHLSCE